MDENGVRSSVDEALEHTEQRERRAPRARARHPPIGAHPRRAAARGDALAARMLVPVETDVSVGRPGRGRGDGLLRRRRGADQRRKHAAPGARVPRASRTARSPSTSATTVWAVPGRTGAASGACGPARGPRRPASKKSSPTDGGMPITTAIPIGGSSPELQLKPGPRRRSKTPPREARVSGQSSHTCTAHSHAQDRSHRSAARPPATGA